MLFTILYFKQHISHQLLVKQNSIEYHLKNMAPTDMAALQRSVADKKALEELEKVHISID